MNKRGFLLAEETLKIIIAVICIIFLVFILVSLFNSTGEEKKMEQAKEILFGTESKVPGIEKIISTLEESESEKKDVLNPEGWHIYTFVGTEKPNSCIEQKCLCICQPTISKQLKSQAKKCNDDGMCLIANNLASREIDLKINSARKPLFIEISKKDSKIIVEAV